MHIHSISDLGFQINFASFSFDNRDHKYYPRRPPPPEMSLSELLRDCMAPIVGLDKVREIKGEGRRTLLYICTICRVRINVRFSCKSNCMFHNISNHNWCLLPGRCRIQPIGRERRLHDRPPCQPGPHAQLLRVHVRHRKQDVGAHPGKCSVGKIY